MIATIKIKVIINKKKESKNMNRFNPPNEEEKNNLNALFQQNYTEWDLIDEASETIVNRLQNCIKRAEEASFSVVRNEIKKPYISDKTYILIVERQKPETKRIAVRRVLHRLIKNAAKKDKRDFGANELEKEDWKEVETTKKGFVPDTQGSNT